MAAADEFDYGPLRGLIGVWKGERGIDISPEPDDTERNPYYETMTFTPAGDVENAEEQTLTILSYHQAVYRVSNDEQFHDQVGYFTWDAASGQITHSFVIPRGVAVVATGGATEGEGGALTRQLDAAEGEAHAISQAPFMLAKARTLAFQQTLVLNGDALSYEETTVLDIYGRRFNHKDKSRLQRAG